MATRTPEQRFDLLVTAIKANQQCKLERQNLNVARSTPVGRYIEPETAKNAAISLIDCFQHLQLNPLEAERRRVPVQCLLKGGKCQQEISAYLQIK